VILASILLSPYIYWHDLSLLVLAGLLLYKFFDATAGQGRVLTVLVLGHVFSIPLIAVDMRASAQVMVVLIAAAMLLLRRQVAQGSMVPPKAQPN
jgi:hypothetical protein